MRDINEPLRIAYAAALTQIDGVGIYYQYLPSGKTPDNYIVFRSINNVDGSTKGSFEFVTNITVEIHTRSTPGNKGLSADAIADQVLQLIYPTRQDNLVLTRGQIYNTEVANDVVQDYRQQNQYGYISRFITFRHLIFVDGTAQSGGGPIMNGGAVLRVDYSGIGGEISYIDSRLIGRNVFYIGKDGIGSAEIITSGMPVDKQALYDRASGLVQFAISFEPNEKSFVLYQLN